MGVWTWSVCVVCLWVILLSVRSGVWENLASNVKYCFTSTSAESNDFSGYSLKTYTGYKETDAMCNLLLFVFFPNCTSLYLFLCENEWMFVPQRVHVWTGTCFITISLPEATSTRGTQAHIFHQTHTKTQMHPQMWQHVYLNVCTHK